MLNSITVITGEERSGKSYLAHTMRTNLRNMGHVVYALDDGRDIMSRLPIEGDTLVKLLGSSSYNTFVLLSGDCGDTLDKLKARFPATSVFYVNTSRAEPTNA